ncbi:MAG: type transport system permease protein [Actinomycetota bacterium]|jgi:ABC-type transport system involved in multi-copper enzyme maturation permease subunit|nr:type transport system permease protein [Actinomycetota bacterium]
MSGFRRPLNPVLARELRVRMRGRQAAVVLTLYLTILSLFLYLTYRSVTDIAALSGISSVASSASAGRNVFQWLLVVMLALVCFIVPGLTGGAITGERERQTLIPLQVTLMKPLSILLGKLGASVAFTLFLVVAALPLIGVAFVLGGVSVGEVIAGTAIVLFIALVLAVFSLGWSSVFRRSQLATVTSYAITLFLVLGTPLIYASQRIASSSYQGSGHTSKAIMVLNPFVLTADVAGGQTGSSSAPLNGLRSFVHPNSYSVGSSLVRSNGTTFTRSNPVRIPQPYEGFPFWVRSVIVFLGLCGTTLAVATYRLRTPAPKER